MSSKTTAIFILALAVLGVGCKGGDNAANSTDKSTTTASTDNTKTADNTPPKDDKAGGDKAGGDMNGSWTIDDPTAKDATVEFKDGTVTMSGPYPGEGMKGVTMEATATYTIDGDKATMHPGDNELVAPADADATIKKKVDDANKAMNSPEAKKNAKDETDTLKWVDKDTFTMTDPKGKVTTFKRKG